KEGLDDVGVEVGAGEEERHDGMGMRGLADAIRLHDECDRLLGRGAGGLHTDRGAEDARKEERVPGAPGEEPPTLDLDGVRGDELGDREAPETDDAAGRAAE